MSNSKYEKIGSRFDHLIEECAELIQIIAKANRFGYTNYHPEDKTKTPNWHLILNEINDVEKRIAEAKEILK